jgi:hypothetical protein
MEKPYTYYTVHKFCVSDLAPVEDMWAEAQAHDVGLHRRGDQYVFTISERWSGSYLTQFVLRWSEWIEEDREEVWVV